jgi:hypothetical protein
VGQRNVPALAFAARTAAVLLLIGLPVLISRNSDGAPSQVAQAGPQQRPELFEIIPASGQAGQAYPIRAMLRGALCVPKS